MSGFAGKLFAGKHELGEYRELEFPPDDGSCFDGFAGQCRQPVNPGGEDGVDGTRQFDIGVLDRPDAVVLLQELLFGEVFEELFKVKRVAVGRAEQQVQEILGNRPFQPVFCKLAHEVSL